MSVKVGVRVRPFNQREVDLNCKLCVDMTGNMTRLFDPDDPDNSKHRDFTFDYSFWSHDGFEVDENGYFVYFSSQLVPPPQNMQIKGMSSNKSASKSLIMPGGATTAVCLPTDRQELASRTQW